MDEIKPCPFCGGKAMVCGSHYVDAQMNVTHWMPLPEPPEEE